MIKMFSDYVFAELLMYRSFGYIDKGFPQLIQYIEDLLYFHFHHHVYFITIIFIITITIFFFIS